MLAMAQTPRKRGRPRKHDTTEGKAKQDVAPERAGDGFRSTFLRDAARDMLVRMPSRTSMGLEIHIITTTFIHARLR
jgi:hypothetical protein